MVTGNSADSDSIRDTWGNLTRSADHKSSMTTTPTLGRLERVDLRSAWQSEAAGFTPWLAQDENIALLGETLDLELEAEAQEKQVGPFRADILCRDVANGAWVLIE